ncbi:hypothetical protein [Clostridium sp.]|uniref:hypothetical protein n=1 Tax=Clostridium sp. TaxID=1506 RepID=UPI00260F47B6|nr:hypothetical protein [Clostridium sp.]
MPNIFDGLRRISDEDMIEQIVLLETMNVTNISKPIIQKVKKKTIGLINFIGSKIGKNQMMEEPEVKEIWTLVNEKRGELKKYTREELDERLLKILTEKTRNHGENPTEDEISVEVIEEAGKLYKIFKNLTPGQKADSIYLKYSDKLSNKAKEYLNEQTFVDLQETTEDIEEIINNMDEKQKKNFLQSVDIENVTLLNVWKKLDRQHFARLIWLCVKAYGGRFTPKEELLPSFIEEEEKEIEILKKDEDLKKSQEELLELKKNIELCKDKIDSIENNLQKENRLLNKAIRDKEHAEEDIINLGKINVKLEEAKKIHEDVLTEIKGRMENALLEELDSLMEEFKKVKFDTIDINNELSDIKIEAGYKKELIEENTKLIVIKEKNIKDISGEFDQLKIDTDNLIKIYNEKKQEVHKKEGQKRSEIFERWSKSFNKFTFDFKNLSNVVNFSRKELLHIEECLYELHYTKDPNAISVGLIESKQEKEEYQYIDVSFPDKFKIEIQYKVLNNQEKNIRIVELTNQF